MSAATPGPWALRGTQIRADNGLGPHVGTYQICRADGLLMAAAFEMHQVLTKRAADCDECDGTGLYPPHSTLRQQFPCDQCADIRAVIAKVGAK